MTDRPEDVMRLAAETCVEHEYSAKNADATWSSVCLAIAEGIMADRASRIRSCLLDKPEAVEGMGVKSELAAEFSRLYAEYRANSDNDHGGAMREEIELLVMENLDVFESALISYLFPADTDAAQSEAEENANG